MEVTPGGPSPHPLALGEPRIHQIDGMYTLATLDQFRTDLQEAAKLRRLLAQ